MPEVSILALRDAIRARHGCDSRWVGDVPVTHTTAGAAVWRGDVHVFDLLSFAKAARAYVWVREGGGAGKRDVTIVLHEGPVDSAHAAVRAFVGETPRAG